MKLPLPYRKLVCLLLPLLTACASHPPTPQWRDRAHSALNDFTASYLGGNTRVAEKDFTRARDAIASTGRGDLLARAELVRCAARVASLEFDGCAGFAPLRQDADAAERSYAAYLTGQWESVDIALLPLQHRAIVVAPATAREHALASISEPLARLVAAGALMQRARLTPVDTLVAIDTASAQGWRRPLLAWLGVALIRADAAGDTASSAQLRRRIALTTGGPL